MVVATYQGIFKRDKCYGAVNVALNQRGIVPLHYPSHPICQYMAIQGWGEGTHQERYRHRDPSGSSGICLTMSLDTEYAIGSIRWQMI